LDFIQAMVYQAAYYGITVDRIEPMTERGDIAVIAGRELPISIAMKRKKLEERIRRDGFHQTMEAIAYTWFNRLVAIRYMEIKGYLDHGYRVLSHPDNKPIPEVLQYAEYLELPGLKKELVIEWKLDGNKENELYRLLLTAQCNALSRTIPFLFGWIDDETELLLPNNLLKTDSLIRALVENLNTEDCESVEVLGWLYQFYISERKDQVMARKSAVPTEDIPAVTQLFTPHWIVRYLVENSLGRLWLLNRPGSRLREHMPYYIEGEKNAPGGSPDDFLKITKPEEIRLCDPAVGSGHMLTYAFDLLTLIYEEEGYAPTEIPALILRHNLHGLEICPRAAQLAELALVFKAREKSRRFFQPEHLVRPRIIELRDVRFAENELRDYIHALGQGDIFQQPMLRLLHQFEEAKNFGSLIQPCLDERAIAFARRAIEAKDLGGQLFLHETHLKVLRVLEQAEALTQRYHVVIANPPYMGSGGMNSKIAQWAAENYSSSKADLSTMFMERGMGLLLKNGSMGMINLPSWLFLSSFEGVRNNLIAAGTIESMLHMGRGIFGIDWGSVAFLVRKAPQAAVAANFFRLHKRNFQHINYEDIGKLFLNAKRDHSYRYDFDQYRDEEGTNEIPAESNPNALRIHYRSYPSEFRKIPTSPIAYWVSEKMRALFACGPTYDDIFFIKAGMCTGHNEAFILSWHEVRFDQIRKDNLAPYAYVPHNKGGPFRKWHGNWDYVLKYSARHIRAMECNVGFRHDGKEFYFKHHIGWSKITSSHSSFRFYPDTFTFDSAGLALFSRGKAHLDDAVCFLNSCIAEQLIKLLNPTLNVTPQILKRLPFISLQPASGDLFQLLYTISKNDWDNFETSWDFRDHPLLRPGLKGATLEASWRNWEAQSTAAIRRMQELETENNRLFIAAYGLDGELQPEVPEAQITLARAEARRDMSAFLSYAVGCMMGRYSPDHPGLILANAGDSLREFLEKVGKPLAELTFAPDEDGIIPVLDGEWFEDDIVARTRDFLRATFGDSTLNKNLMFIEQSLGKDGKPKSLRDYCTVDFYKDHLQTYKKRPIYWLFSSGKVRAFQCLVYLHRYNEGTLARMRTEYVIPLQGQIAARIDQLEGDKAKATSTSHRTKIQKEQDKLKKQQEELATFEEKLKHYADMRISLDLDDGVKVNYAKFGDLLAESKAITGGKDDE
jgi:hypothetical protein